MKKTFESWKQDTLADLRQLDPRTDKRVIYNLLSTLAVLGYGWVCYYWVVNFAIPIVKEITDMGDVIWWWKYPTVEEQKAALEEQSKEIERQTEEIIKRLQDK